MLKIVRIDLIIIKQSWKFWTLMEESSTDRHFYFSDPSQTHTPSLFPVTRPIRFLLQSSVWTLPFQSHWIIQCLRIVDGDVKFEIGLFLQAARNVTVSTMFIEECTFDPIIWSGTKFVNVCTHSMGVVEHDLMQKGGLVAALHHWKMLISAVTQPRVIVWEDTIELLNSGGIVSLQINDICPWDKPAFDGEISKICLQFWRKVFISLVTDVSADDDAWVPILSCFFELLYCLMTREHFFKSDIGLMLLFIHDKADKGRPATSHFDGLKLETIIVVHVADINAVKITNEFRERKHKISIVRLPFG